MSKTIMCPSISDASGGTTPSHFGGRLTIDLDALADNWRTLHKLAAPGACGAAVKADAYGLGLAPVAKKLWQAGCRHFFVALPEEGFALRALLPDANIFCLGGLTPGGAADYLSANLTPVLNSLSDVAAWVEAAPNVPAVLHVDTGMNRLGLRLAEAEGLAATMPAGLNLQCVMTHLACADEPDHPLNAIQVANFEKATALFRTIPNSFANSAGTLLGGPYKSDLSRPGIALYGGASAPVSPNPIKPVIRLEARIIQVRDVQAGDAVGYGATQTMTRDGRIAILSAGYADGYHRLVGSDDEACVMIGDERAPLIGRISMDLTAVDISDVRQPVEAGDFVDLINDRYTVDDVARCAQTIGYEILTGLGRRYHRIYVGGAD